MVYLTLIQVLVATAVAVVAAGTAVHARHAHGGDVMMAATWW